MLEVKVRKRQWKKLQNSPFLEENVRVHKTQLSELVFYFYLMEKGYGNDCRNALSERGLAAEAYEKISWFMARASMLPSAHAWPGPQGPTGAPRGLNPSLFLPSFLTHLGQQF